MQGVFDVLAGCLGGLVRQRGNGMFPRADLIRYISEKRDIDIIVIVFAFFCRYIHLNVIFRVVGEAILWQHSSG